MAQQTINVGAAPNDGTGTPLRTAFQYTNSNFSELYTATGPSGNNITVPGTATITGNLTAGGNVGFGTTNLTSISGYNTLKINNATNGAILDLAQGDAYKGRVIGSLSGLVLESAAGLPIQLQVGGLNSFKADPAGVYIWYDGAGGVNQRMQLNSTGLGVGASPNAKLTVYGGGATTSTVNFSGGSAGSDNATIASNYNLNFQVDANNTIGGRAFIWRYGGKGYSDGTHLMTLDASGRLLVGPTSANASGGVLQLSSGITFPATQVASSDANTLDDYEEGTWTATLKGSVSDPTTPVTATGRYTKIGRQVSIQLFVNNVTTTGASGRIQIDGLPFANNGSVEAISNVGFYNMATFTGVPFGLTSASSTVIDMWSSVSAGVFQAVNYNPGSVQYVWVNLTYTV